MVVDEKSNVQEQLDLKKLDTKSVEALRAQLRNALGRGQASQVLDAMQTDTVVAHHSSHTDNDGWI